jgi:hypothetical protein
MKTMRSLSDALLAIARELAGAAASRPGDPNAFHERVLRAAAKQSESAALIVAALAEHDHALALERCAEPCRCPHDFGDHLAEAPHRCDAVDVEVDDDGRERLSPCPCPGFEAGTRARAGDTIPAADLARPTTPSPAAPLRLLERAP